MTVSQADLDAIAKLLWIFPPPARTMLAPRIAGLGVRVHPELATKQLVREGPANEGNWAAQRLEPIDKGHQLLNPPTSEEEIARVERVAALVLVLSTVMPTRIAPDIAPELDALGMRVHTDLTTSGVKFGAPKILDLMRRSGGQVGELAERVEHANKLAAKGDFSARDKLGEELRPAAMAQMAEMRRKAPTIKAEDLEPVEEGSAGR